MLKDVQLQIHPVEALAAEDKAVVEDDISDPEEDSIAGQMAAMRGKPVRRIDDDGAEVEEEEDDTSGSEEEWEWSETSESESD